MFSRSITLFELLGFRIKVDASWLLLAVLITWSLAVGYFPYVLPDLPGFLYWWMGVIGLIGLAASIVAHELGHAVVARRYDMPIRGITLFIFGGVAEMEDEPPSAKAELWMALAGPAVSIVIAVALFLFSTLITGITGTVTPLAAVFSYLALINGILAIFNMLPAFPLDGGRVMRALLWQRKGDIIGATRTAAFTGSAFGIALITLGLVSALMGNIIGGIWWFILGLFVRAAAGGALDMAVTRGALKDLRVDRFMRPDVVTVDTDTTLDRLIEDYFYRYYFKSFPVVTGQRLTGVVTIEAIKGIDQTKWPWTDAASVMEEPNGDNTVNRDAEASVALTKMRVTGNSRLYVIEPKDGKLVGVLSLKDLLNFLSIKMDIDEARNARQSSPGHGFR